MTKIDSAVIADQHENQQYNIEPGYRWRHNIMCCTSGELVYVRNLKCGSTFFYENLIKIFKWDECAWTEIDWQHQRVFGHIMDPWQRRIKGIAECLSMYGFNQQFQRDEQFRKLIVEIPVLDQHSASYHDYFGNLAWSIDWIPVQTNHNHTIALTEKLMEHYRINILDRWNRSLAHEGDADKKHTEQLLSAEIKKSKSMPEYIGNHFHADWELWRTVVSKFKPNETTWPRISWLDQSKGMA